MAYDELLRLSGSTNNAEETVSASGNGTPVLVGERRTFEVEVRVGGAVSGTNETLDVKLQDSADGVSFADMGVSFTQITATMLAATGVDTKQVRVARTASDRPYVRIVKTIGGTDSPSFGGFSALIVPIGVAASV